MSVIAIDPDVQGGTPCFRGTRVPIKNFFDHIEGDYSVTEFLQQFPSVDREQVLALLEELKQLPIHSSAAEA